MLDASFPAADELLLLLYALGGRRVVVLSNSKPTPQKWKGPSRLFGTVGRTRALIALAHLGACSLSDLAAASATPERSIGNIVRFFESEGVVSIEAEAQEHLVSLSPGHPAAEPLRQLLLKMAPCVPGLVTRVALLVERRREQHRPPVFERGESARLPIGTSAQSAVLELVGRVPLRSVDIVKKTGLSRYTVRQVLDTLETYGLIVTTTVGAGPSAARWAVFNQKHPLCRPVGAFIETLPICRETGLCELPPRNLRRSGPVGDGLPGLRELRAHVLMHVHEAGELDIGALAKRLDRTDRTALRRAADGLRMAGLVEYGTFEGRETVRAVSDAASLDALLTAMRRFLDGST